jgi:hypothetical protein
MNYVSRIAVSAGNFESQNSAESVMHIVTIVRVILMEFVLMIVQTNHYT